MARAFTAVKSKAGKEIKCGRCDAKVEPGQRYYYFSVGFRGSKQIRCSLHPPKTSELTGSKMSGAYAAIESIEDVLADTSHTTQEDVANTLESAASDIESVRDEYQESFDNLPENFQNSSQGEEIQEKIDALEEFISELNDAAQEARDFEEPDNDKDDDALTQAVERANDALATFSQ